MHTFLVFYSILMSIIAALLFYFTIKKNYEKNKAYDMLTQIKTKLTETEVLLKQNRIAYNEMNERLKKPPAYKIGEVIDKKIIVIDIFWSQKPEKALSNLFLLTLSAAYIGLDFKKSKEIAANIDYGWNYKVFNKHTGENQIISEFALLFLNEKK